MHVKLTPMKMLQVVVPGERAEVVKEILQLAHVSGYTLIPNVSGMGHDGYHEGRLLFNEMNSQVMVISVLTEEQVDVVINGLDQLFETSSGVVFVSDCSVRRYGYFVAEKNDN